MQIGINGLKKVKIKKPCLMLLIILTVYIMRYFVSIYDLHILTLHYLPIIMLLMRVSTRELLVPFQQLWYMKGLFWWPGLEPTIRTHDLLSGPVLYTRVQ